MRKVLLSARTRRVIAAIAGLALAGFLLRTFLGGGPELQRAGSLLAHPEPGWLALAIAVEVASYAAYATAQRGLARAAGHRLERSWLASLAVAAQALNNFLPAGYVMANLLNFRELRRRELSGSVSAWLLVMSTVLYIGALAVMALIASLIAGSHGGEIASDVRNGAAALLGGLGVLALVARGLARRGRLRGAATLRRLHAQLAQVRLSRRAIATAAACFAAAWLADAACLVVSFAAVGQAPPWGLVGLAYGAAQLVSFLPLTPGGLGLVEGSLTLGLAAGGGGGAHTLAAVLLYRLLSYWAAGPAGAAGYMWLRRSRRSGVGALGLPAPALAARVAPAPAVAGETTAAS